MEEIQRIDDIHERISSPYTAAIGVLRVYKVGLIASAQYGRGILVARLPNKGNKQ